MGYCVTLNGQICIFSILLYSGYCKVVDQCPFSETHFMFLQYIDISQQKRRTATFYRCQCFFVDTFTPYKPMLQKRDAPISENFSCSFKWVVECWLRFSALRPTKYFLKRSMNMTTVSEIVGSSFLEKKLENFLNRSWGKLADVSFYSLKRALYVISKGFNAEIGQRTPNLLISFCPPFPKS